MGPLCVIGACIRTCMFFEHGLHAALIVDRCLTCERHGLSTGGSRLSVDDTSFCRKKPVILFVFIIIYIQYNTIIYTMLFAALILVLEQSGS